MYYYSSGFDFINLTGKKFKSIDNGHIKQLDNGKFLFKHNILTKQDVISRIEQDLIFLNYKLEELQK